MVVVFSAREAEFMAPIAWQDLAREDSNVPKRFLTHSCAQPDGKT